ncbi:Endoglin CD105 antigen [Schistosoma japonicum]|nr:Endoglin CD105 antigen [Schistosoma japonicum]
MASLSTPRHFDFMTFNDVPYSLFILSKVNCKDRKNCQLGEKRLSGACSQYDLGFCSRQVENSVCNHEKNECFCRKGFVAIRENGRVTCKTLLTDLKCRVDRDCVHVNRSSCHPGAGYCSCPGNTIYVPEKHACRSRFIYPNDPFCDVCLQLKGTCFKYELFDRVVTDQRVNPNGVGCVCPDHRVSINTRTSDPLKYMCDGNLVDIGSECDDESLFCRSINSVCKPVQEELLLSSTQLYSIPSSLWSENFPSGDPLRRNQIIRTCMCKPGYLPVYQINLKYNECFKILPMKAKRCQKCVDTGGQCYDLDDDGTGDGCDCPPSLSSIVYGKENSEIFCGTAHVSVNCTDGHFTVCYYPHSYGPYKNLFEDLVNYRSVVRLASGSYSTETIPRQTLVSLLNSVNATYRSANFQSSCMLKLENDTTDNENTFETDSFSFGNHHLHGKQSRRFCLNVDVWRQNGLCGIRLYKLGRDTVQYEGILEVLVNNSIRTPSKDKIIPLKCISRIPNRPMNKINENLQALETMSSSDTFTHPQISLRILNEKNKEILSAFVGLRIRLDALLIDPPGKCYIIGPYKYIAAEYCYGNNRSVHLNYSISETGTLLIDHRCSPRKTLLSAKFSNNGLLNGHLQTEIFQAFRLGNMTSVFFTCVFRLCQLSKDCEQVYPFCLLLELFMYGF